MSGSVFLLSWVGLLATLGLAWHECLLLASAALAACRFNLWYLRRQTSRDLWRLGVRCLLAGSIGLAAAAALGVTCLIAGIMDWCREADASTLILVALSGALWCRMQSSERRVLLEAGPWLLLLAGAGAATLGAVGTATTWACSAAGATLVHLAICTWLLAREGTAMLAGAAAR